MPILNKVVNILVLVAGITAVVFSYLLFSKREKLTDGWNQMAKAINQAAVAIDAGGASGTKAATELAVANMDHKKYEALPTVLPKLGENLKRIMSQRDGLASALSSNASLWELSGFAATDMKNVDKYSQKTQELAGRLQTVKSRRDRVAAGYASLGRTVGASVRVDEFKNERCEAAIKSVGERVNDIAARRSQYENYLNQTARMLLIKNINLRTPEYKKALGDYNKGVVNYRNEHNRTVAALRSEVAKTKRLTAQLDAGNRKIKTHENTINICKKEINDLRRILDDNGRKPVPPKRLTSQDIECLDFVRGKVTSVDKEYGFITVDTGYLFSFVQQYGTKENVVQYPLPAGKVMTVARGLDGDSPLLVGKVFVKTVGADCSICNIVSGDPEKFEVGDTVFFSTDDIKAFKETKKVKKQ